MSWHNEKESFWEKHGLTPRQIGDGIGQTLEGVKQGAKDAYVGSARLLYEYGRFAHFHTSYEPVYYGDIPLEGFKAELREKLGLKPGNPAETAVSIPFKMGSERIRAARTPKVMDLWDKNYPLLLLVFHDPTPKVTGDEVIQLEPGGAVEEILHVDRGNVPTWRIWMPGSYEIVITAGREERVIKKNQASLTAADVVDNFVGAVNESSRGRVTLSARDMHLALGMLTKRSEALQQRWDLLDERLTFQKHLVKHGEVMASFLWPMMEFTPEEFNDLVRQLSEGRITTWEQWSDAFNNMPDLLIQPTSAVLPRVMFEGLKLIPGPSGKDKFVPVPARLFSSFAGISYWNGLMDTYEHEVKPMLKGLGVKSGLVMKESVGALLDLKQAQIEAWQAARLEIEHKKPELIDALRAEARALLEESAKDSHRILTGEKSKRTKSLPAPSTGTTPPDVTPAQPTRNSNDDEDSFYSKYNL